MGVGLLEMRELKFVTVGIQQRGQWDVIRDRREEWELEVEVIENTVVYGSEVLVFELGGLHMKPFKEGNLVIVEKGSFEDLKVPLVLLCVSQWVINVAGNGGLM